MTIGGTPQVFSSSEWLETFFFFRMPKSWTFSRNDLWAVSSLADSTSFFSSSMSRFSFARRFWNQVITCAFDRPKAPAISSRSAGERYFWYRNLFSSSKIWWFVNAVLDFRFFFGCCRLLNKWRWFAWPSAKNQQKRFKYKTRIKKCEIETMPPTNLRVKMIKYLPGLLPDLRGCSLVHQSSHYRPIPGFLQD